MPLSLAPSQWDPLIATLSAQFCTISLGGPLLGVERIEGLFEAIAASGVDRLPAERRYLRRDQALRDGISVSNRNWTTLHELLA